MKTTAGTSKHELYKKAYIRTFKQYAANPAQGIEAFINKIIFYGVKMVNTQPEHQTITIDEAIQDFQTTEIIQLLMGLLTPMEFINQFPVKKEYDGNKYETKDYFYTMDYLRALPSDEPIGDLEAVSKLLWDYVNWDITKFNLKIFRYMDNLRRFQGQPSMAEEWAAMNGIKTYTKHTDQKGREFMLDKETGRSFSVKKPKPRYLRAVK